MFLGINKVIIKECLVLFFLFIVEIDDKFFVFFYFGCIKMLYRGIDLYYLSFYKDIRMFI